MDGYFKVKTVQPLCHLLNLNFIDMITKPHGGHSINVLFLICFFQMDRSSTSIPYRTMPLLLSTPEGVPLDGRLMWHMWRPSSATNVTFHIPTNQTSRRNKENLNIRITFIGCLTKKGGKKE